MKATRITRYVLIAVVFALCLIQAKGQSMRAQVEVLMGVPDTDKDRKIDMIITKRNGVMYGNIWQDLSVEERKKVLVGWIREFETERVRTRLSVLAIYARQFPFTGIGITFDVAAKKRSEGSVEYGLQVTRVYKNSPAQKAGIRTGDWISSIAGANIPIIGLPEDDPQFEQIRARVLDLFSRLVNLTEGGINLTCERDGKSTVYTNVAKAQIGQEIFEFARGRMQGWFAALEGQKPLVASLKKSVDQAGLDQAKLDECFFEALRVALAVEKPFNDFEDFESRFLDQQP